MVGEAPARSGYGRTLLHALSIAAAVIACGCGFQTPSAYLDNDEVRSAVQEMLARYAANTSDPALACLGTLTVLESRYGSYYDQHRDAPDVTGTWNMNNCRIVATSDGTRVGTCSGQTIWTSQRNGEVTQSNVGSTTSGSGAVSLVAANGTSNAIVFRHNTASGSGCRQELVNMLLLIDVPGGARGWGVCGLTVLLDSTCGGPLWQVFQSDFEP
jgi:hypothetical protein